MTCYVVRLPPGRNIYFAGGRSSSFSTSSIAVPSPASSSSSPLRIPARKRTRLAISWSVASSGISAIALRTISLLVIPRQSLRFRFDAPASNSTPCSAVFNSPLSGWRAVFVMRGYAIRSSKSNSTSDQTSDQYRWTHLDNIRSSPSRL
jgi:hypothetical protein